MRVDLTSSQNTAKNYPRWSRMAGMHYLVDVFIQKIKSHVDSSSLIHLRKKVPPVWLIKRRTINKRTINNLFVPSKLGLFLISVRKTLGSQKIVNHKLRTIAELTNQKVLWEKAPKVYVTPVITKENTCHVGCNGERYERQGRSGGQRKKRKKRKKKSKKRMQQKKSPLQKNQMPPQSKNSMSQLFKCAKITWIPDGNSQRQANSQFGTLTLTSRACLPWMVKSSMLPTTKCVLWCLAPKIRTLRRRQR